MSSMQAYEAPSVEKIGTFESITQHAGSGRRLDASFPTDTPFEDLTFS